MTTKIKESPIAMAATVSETAAAVKAGAPLVVANLGTEMDALRDLIHALGVSKCSCAFPEIRDIRVTGARHSVAESTGEHAPHTDGTFEENPPTRFILNFVQTDQCGGGVSTFWSVKDLLKAMPQHLKDVLRTTPVVFARVTDDSRVQTRSTILYRRPDGREVIRWRYDAQVFPVPTETSPYFDEAIAWVRAYLQNTPPITYSASVGDCIVVDNDAVLHGRTELVEGSSRHVRRVWLS